MLQYLGPLWHHAYHSLSIFKCMVVLLHAEKSKRSIAVKMWTLWINLNATCIMQHCFNVLFFLHTRIATFFAIISLHIQK